MGIHSTGKLRLTNSETKDVYEYDVEVIGETMILTSHGKMFKLRQISETTIDSINDEIKTLEEKANELRATKKELFGDD